MVIYRTVLLSVGLLDINRHLHDGCNFSISKIFNSALISKFDSCVNIVLKTAISYMEQHQPAHAACEETILESCTVPWGYPRLLDNVIDDRGKSQNHPRS